MTIAVEKPAQLSLATRVLEHRGRCHLVVSMLCAVELDDRSRLLLESTLWQRALAALPEATVLDEGLPKARGEVLAAASAHPAGGKPATAVPVRLVLGSCDKRLWVVGDRRWEHGATSAPMPFTAMPIDYHHAFGGPGSAANPLGRGVDGAVLPNVEHPRHRIASLADRPEPAGFGPLDVTWPERARHAGTYDQRWLEHRYPGYPDDTAPPLFQTAPTDQRIDGYFMGDERYVLEGMHPNAPQISGTLPSVAARLWGRSVGATTLEEIPTRLDTVWLLPGARTAVLVFRGVCDAADDDASDVALLLAGLEWSGQSKPRAHYEDVLARRSDEQWGLIASLCDTDLLPRGCEHEMLVEASQGEPKPIWAANLRRRAQMELEATRERLRAAGVDPDEQGVPATLPEPDAIPELQELPAYLAALHDKADALRREAEDARARAEEQHRASCLEMGIDYEGMRERAAAEAAGPPKFRADAQIQQLRDQLELAANAGVGLPHVAAQLAEPGLRARLLAAERALFDGYRRFAHHMPSAAPLAGEERTRLRAEIEAALHAGEPLAGRDLTGADLSGLDLAGRDLSGCFLEASNLAGSDLSGASLERAVLARADLSSATLRKSRLAGANLGSARLEGADLEGADLCGAILDGAMLTGTRLRDADLTDASLSAAAFVDTDLAGARLCDAVFIDQTLRGMAAPNADLAGASFIEIDMAGVDLRGARMSKASLIDTRADGVRLAGANLRGVVITMGSSLTDADLSGADLTGANLSGSALARANLIGACLDKANLDEVDLRGACLQRAIARDARLCRTSLRDADAGGVNLMRAMLRKADLRGARCEGSNLFRTDLHRVLGDGQTSFRGALIDQTRVVKPRGGATRIDG